MMITKFSIEASQYPLPHWKELMCYCDFELAKKALPYFRRDTKKRLRIVKVTREIWYESIQDDIDSNVGKVGISST